MHTKIVLSDYKKSLNSPLKKTMLCFLIKDDQILLAMKKRKFGVGKWNGAGGKVEAGEAVEEAAVREVQEEIGVTPKKLEKVAILYFYYPHAPLDENWNQETVVYFVNDWEGEPSESEEMNPQWFDQSNLPFDQMWPDDKYWLPRVLKGEKLEADFIFNDNQELEDFKIKTLENIIIENRV